MSVLRLANRKQSGALRRHVLLWVLLPLLAASVAALALSARPALAAPPAAPLEQAATPAPLPVTMTVGRSAQECAAGDRVTVQLGSPVYICYRIVNSVPLSSTSLVTLTNQVVYEADADGANSRSQPFAQRIAPSAQSDLLAMSPYTPTATVVRRGVVAANAGSGPQQVDGSDSVEITVVNPQITVQQTLSTSPDGCSSDTSLTLPTNTRVYRCIRLTNTGDATFTQTVFTVTPNAVAGTPYTLNAPLAKGATLALTSAQPQGVNANAFFFNPTATITSTVAVSATTADGFPATASSSANVTIGTATTTLGAVPLTRAECGSESATSISVLTQTPIYYCLRLRNSGTTTLTSHRIGMTGQTPVTIDIPLEPSASLVITTGTLTARGLPALLGPVIATANLNNSFVVTSTAGLFRFITTAATTSVLASTPTWTPTAVPTPLPTWTPFPIAPTWTPVPTWTPTETPLPPTPTWTRSFELSNLQTPTPRADQLSGAADPAAVDFQATAAAQGDPNAFLTPDFSTNPPFDSGLPTPFIDPNNPEQVGIQETIAATETPVPPPTDTPAPTRTPLPTQTPTPTVTPTATQRPIVFAAPAQPPGFGGLFTAVLDSTLAAAGILFVATGAVVFFGVLAAILAFGFLRNSRRPYRLEETGEDDPDFTTTTGARGQAGAPGDRWPTSLP